MSDPTRRTIIAGLVGAGGMLAASRFAGLRAAEADALVVRASRPHDFETAPAALDAELTPNELFFVRSHFGPAVIDAQSYRLEIGGLVDKPIALSLAELRRLPKVTLPAVLQCAGNGRSFFGPRVPGAQWGRGGVGQAMWTGVRLGDILRRAGVKRDGKFVRLLGGERPPMPTTPTFARSIPLDKALHPATLVAYEMNGAPLPLLHGAPLRAVVPGWVGDDWVKWLRSVRVEAAEDAGFYMKTGYRLPEPPVKPGEAPKPESMRAMTSMVVKALITRPLAGARVVGGGAVTGVAFAGERAVRSVEVSTDGGKTWRAAELARSKGIGSWQRFELGWKAPPGRYRLLARATDEAGVTQPERPAWNPGGYLWNGWDEVACEVTA